MAILVTGGSGFIGRFLIRELAKRGEDEIRVIDINQDDKLKAELPGVQFYKLDVSQITQWDSLLADVKLIYHLGGLLGTSELFERIIEAERVNVIGTLNILEAMRKYGVKKILFTSKPNVWKHNVYTITKENCERYLDMYHEIYGIEYVILRPFNVYGPEEKIEQYRKAVPYFIISACNNKPLEIYGNGKQTMDLVYVSDCVNAMIQAANEPAAIRHTIEIGTGKGTDVNGLANLIVNMVGSQSEVRHIPMRKGEIEDTLLSANTKEMEQILKYRPKWSLEAGLKETIQHYKSNLNKYNVIYGQ
jgi:UDP-glucose 4-epimerase